MIFSEAIEEYIRHIKVELGYSPTTILNYQNRLRYLNNWMLDNGYPSPTIHDITTPMLRRFLETLVERKQRPRTIKGKFAAINGFCKFMVAQNHLPENSTTKIQLPKLDAARRLLITDDQITLLDNACALLDSPRRQALGRAVLSILSLAGLRRAECRDLMIGDVNVAEKYIFVRSGKGAKSRRVFLSSSAADHLREWQALRGECNHDYLFGTAHRRLHDDGLANLIEDLKRLSGQSGNDAIKPHSIRHAFGTRLLRNGANIVDISAALGHTGANALRTTQIYLSTNEEQLRSLADLAEIRPKELEAEPIVAPSPAPPAAPQSPSVGNKEWRVRTIRRQ